MDRVYESGASGSPPSSALNTVSGYPSVGNPGGGVQPSKPGAYMWHQIIEEMMAVIAAAGITPDKTNLGQLLAAIRALPGNSLTGWSEPVASPAISAGVLLLNMAANNVFAVSLNANVTTTTPQNVPTTGKFAQMTLIVTADGSARTWAWLTSTVQWGNAGVPTLTVTNAKKDTFNIYTTDGGTTWTGVVVSQNR